MTNRRKVLALRILGGIAVAALAAACTSGGHRTAGTGSAALALDIYTADTEGLGVTSTLIYGEREAILVDTQFRTSDAEKLAARIAAKGRRLTAIIVTHPHFDHFYGASVLLKRFPGTPVFASAADVEVIKRDLAGTLAQIRARFGATDIPADIQIPLPWPSTHFTVDGQSVDVLAGLQGDVGPGPHNNIVWVPSLAAAIVGDIAFNQVHLSLRATDAQSRKAWIETLRSIEARKPRIVVAGHKNDPALPDSPDVLAFNKAYLAEFEVALAASHNARELVAAMKQKFPQAGLDRILNFTAARFFPS
ncbi:MAG TPA: MBL fold metallo-hydrolase [Methylomirabilota bacterium]|nr:MBL fold metallo-hydrolase [Methylomirabilota bacterium]